MITPRLNMHAVLASALLLAACKPSPAPKPIQVWPLSEQAAMTRLAQADVAGLGNALRCSNDIEITPGPLGAHTISWNIARGFNQLGTFTVRLTAISTGNTHSDIDIPSDGQGGELFDASHPTPNPVFKAPLRAAVGELVRAAMEQRSFDAQQLPGGAPSDQLCGHSTSGPVNPGAAPPPQPSMPDASPPQNQASAPQPQSPPPPAEAEEEPSRNQGGAVKID